MKPLYPSASLFSQVTSSIATLTRVSYDNGSRPNLNQFVRNNETYENDDVPYEAPKKKFGSNLTVDQDGEGGGGFGVFIRRVSSAFVGTPHK